MEDEMNLTICSNIASASIKHHSMGRKTRITKRFEHRTLHSLQEFELEWVYLQTNFKNRHKWMKYININI